jgi:hypothetical protein
MTDSLFTVPAEVARPLREGLHTEFGIAAEQIVDLAEIGGRPFEVYRGCSYRAAGRCAGPLASDDEARRKPRLVAGSTAERSGHRKGSGRSLPGMAARPSAARTVDPVEAPSWCGPLAGPDW